MSSSLQEFIEMDPSSPNSADLQRLISLSRRYVLSLYVFASLWVQFFIALALDVGRILKLLTIGGKSKARGQRTCPTVFPRPLAFRTQKLLLPNEVIVVIPQGSSVVVVRTNDLSLLPLHGGNKSSAGGLNLTDRIPGLQALETFWGIQGATCVYQCFKAQCHCRRTMRADWRKIINNLFLSKRHSHLFRAMVPTPNPGGQVGDRHCGGEWFFHSNTPHFFKIILPRDVRNLNLRIPVKFVRNHGSALSSDLVFLEVPSGSLWKVKLLRDEHGVLLQDGCADFIKHYNIRPGQFLVFRHDSGSRFRVVIFDETACEITYRIGPDQDRDKGDELLRGPVKEERLLDRRPNVTGRKRKPDPPPECPNNVKVSRNKRRGASLVNVRGASGPARPTGLPSQVSAKASDGRNAEGEAKGHLNSSCINFSPGAEVAQRSGALSRATSLRCEGPSSFVIVQPTLVHPNFLLLSLQY
ncbi:hypothetical protein MLD38_037848 [Melastoma candidum]|uniref:Uncharacterized protein n=1 Tax=Melastoma candidum TaxID=119954 RepID=A0ACB9LPV1_9MYRT|nr:hypothetical protein MLD38_037848 [Melastoma candidum]